MKMEKQICLSEIEYLPRIIKSSEFFSELLRQCGCLDTRGPYAKSEMFSFEREDEGDYLEKFASEMFDESYLN